MSAAAVSVVGWGCALSALVALCLLRWRLDTRMALVAEASHELRGPLSAVRLGLATLIRDAGPESARHATALELELRRAGMALEDLAAAPSGRRTPDRAGPVDVADLLWEAGDVWGTVAAALGTEIQVSHPAEWWVVRADRLRLAQALGNLVSNAIEHGVAPVQLRARSHRGDTLRLEVVDAGTGLPGHLPPGSRGHIGRRGHGLAVAARVAHGCGGRLTSERCLEGHVMSLELPLLCRGFGDR